MATTLDKPLIRETGLTVDGREFMVILIPNASGGAVTFKEKGKRGQGIEVSLAKILSEALGGKKPEVAEDDAPVKPESKPVFEGDPSSLDLVDLGLLENRLMIDASEEMNQGNVKGHLWSIIREMREERRDEAGAPVLVRGPSRKKRESGNVAD
jgi:hypothetical protein